MLAADSAARGPPTTPSFPAAEWVSQQPPLGRKDTVGVCPGKGSCPTKSSVEAPEPWHRGGAHPDQALVLRLTEDSHDFPQLGVPRPLHSCLEGSGWSGLCPSGPDLRSRLFKASAGFQADGTGRGLWPQGQGGSLHSSQDDEQGGCLEK